MYYMGLIWGRQKKHYLISLTFHNIVLLDIFIPMFLIFVCFMFNFTHLSQCTTVLYYKINILNQLTLMIAHCLILSSVSNLIFVLLPKWLSNVALAYVCVLVNMLDGHTAINIQHIVCRMHDMTIMYG